ncbi:hypothetical protein H1S01_05580 [Heliobacterium chlorum]|uniref:Uncharacterized protein n=1 Tax=Heliobacterium chlorum TaxID=2698 RepID=A0ABR7T362_HELCL|nr:hypothetical protein [Heliobacterium chlorum]MBC9783981.1 hypothetical protein [Heliobacterium chlorum]
MVGRLMLTLLSGAAAYTYAEKKYQEVTERKIAEGLNKLRPVVNALYESETKRIGVNYSSAAQ